MSDVSSQENPAASKNDRLRLFLISFAVLFFEVLFIRFIPSEIRVFGFFNNVLLIAAVVGMGLGCASATTNTTPGRGMQFWFPVLLSILAGILLAAPQAGLTHMSFVVKLDQFTWDSGVHDLSTLVYNVTALILIFLLVVGSFDSLGRQLGNEIAKHKPLSGYSINLLGSIVGLVVYSTLSYFGAPPAVWIIVGSLAIFPFCVPRWSAAILVVPIVIAHLIAQGSIWSPYYRIDLFPHYALANPQPGEQQYRDGTVIQVNHNIHQTPIDLSDAFVKQHPDRINTVEYNSFNMPYEAKLNPKNVLILGAGSGNDVAAALRHGAEHVDAVEIDPTILSLGLTEHPEKPYDDKRVERHTGDARTFLANATGKYDLIVFGHVDSHTAFSALSSVRLDNFLYTEESLKSATARLAPDGVVALSFAGGPIWLRARLYQLAEKASGSPPLILETGYNNRHSISLFWGPGLEKNRAGILERHANLALNPKDFSFPVELTNDDWPFLYQEGRTMPLVYIGMLTLVVFLSSGLAIMRFRLNPQSFAANSQFFFLGAGFLLLETRAILAMSVLFGSTWVVTSIVIAVILLMALLANYLVERNEWLKEEHGYSALLICLLLMYFLPLNQLITQPISIRYLAACALIGVPFICTGIVFSRAFSKAAEPQKALGINIIGAVLGGCLEYLSMITGSNALALLALALYAISFFTRRR